MIDPTTTTTWQINENTAISLTNLVHKSRFFAISLIFLPIFLSSCVYQFTNTHIELPSGIQSIAVEAVFDTSREPVHHEILWKSLQRAIAKDGHLRLAPQSEADAILRAQLRQVNVSQYGAPFQRAEKDPTLFKGGEPPLPSEFRQLPTASRYALKENLTMLVTVEVWNLHSGELVMRRDYSGERKFPSAHPTTLTTLDNNFLRHEEALTTSIAVISDSIAQQVIQGLLVL